MRKHLLVFFSAVLYGSTSAIAAEETKKYDIQKDESGKVVVSCEYAAKMPDGYLHQVINGPYSVADENGEECPTKVTISKKPKDPIIGGPGIPIPIGPRCKCPETYEAEMQLRWMSLYQTEIERSQRDLAKQFENIEIMLDQKNLRYLLNRPEFGNLNQLRQ